MDSSPVQYPDKCWEYVAPFILNFHAKAKNPECLFCNTAQALTEAIENWLVQIPDSVERDEDFPYGYPTF